MRILCTDIATSDIHVLIHYLLYNHHYLKKQTNKQTKIKYVTNDKSTPVSIKRKWRHRASQ